MSWLLLLESQRKFHPMSPKTVIVALVVWQFFFVLFVALGILPQFLVWMNLGLSLLFLLLFDSFHSLLFLVASLPFYVVLPNQRFDTLSTWRVLFAFLFLVWLWRQFMEEWKAFGQTSVRQKISAVFGNIFLPAWDKFLGLFALVALLTTLLFAKFPMQGLRQILFWFNIYLFYVVLVNELKSGRRLKELVKFSVLSLGLIVVLGFGQLAATFLGDLDTFWVFWASFVSKLYYGREFMNVALYSNSWFSFTVGRELRMFSILPDSHSFALICVFAMAYLSPLTYLFGKRGAYLLWSAVRFSGLAVILSGTRAVWAGMVAPLLAVAVLYLKNWFRPSMKKAAWSMIFVILFFALSPLINRGLQYLRVGKFEENFLARAKTIYDLEESSNVSRLFVWQESLSGFLRQPWGVGVGNFLTVLAPAGGQNESFKDLAEQKSERFNLPQKYVTAHSLYLQIAVETGVLGLIGFLAFWYVYGKSVWRFLARRRQDNNFFVFLTLQLALAFLWLLVAAVFDVTIFNDRILIYVFLSLGVTAAILKNYERFKNESD